MSTLKTRSFGVLWLKFKRLQLGTHMKFKTTSDKKMHAGNSLSSLLKGSSTEERDRIFKTVIDGANASQRVIVEQARRKASCVA